MQSVYLDWSFKTSLTKSAKNRLIFKDTLNFQIGISLTFLDGLHRNFAWWLTITSFIFLFFSCIINSQHFFCFWHLFKFLIRHLGKKWVKPEVGIKCIYFLNNNVSSYVWMKFGMNRSTCTIWLFLCTNRPYYLDIFGLDWHAVIRVLRSVTIYHYQQPFGINSKLNVIYIFHMIFWLAHALWLYYELVSVLVLCIDL